MLTTVPECESNPALTSNKPQIARDRDGESGNGSVRLTASVWGQEGGPYTAPVEGKQPKQPMYF